MSDEPPDRPHRQMRDRPAASGPRKWNRAALIAAGTLTVAVAVSAGLAAAGGHRTPASLSSEVTAPTKTLVTPASAPAPAPASASAPASAPAPAPASASVPASAPASASASAPWSSTSCPSQLASWRRTGAGGQLQVVVTDLTIVSQAAAPLHADLASGTAPSAAVTALHSATTSLRAGIQVARKNLIPGCVSGAYQAEVAGLTDLGGAVAGFDNAADATDSGDYGAAQRGMRTAVAAMQSGSAEMATAIAGLNRYGTR
jgi:flagellar hook-basal body complex protein FliE